MTDRDTRLKALEEFVTDLGLELMIVRKLGEGEYLRRYDWPKAKHGGQYDRTVLIFENSDGTWSEYIDTSRVNVSSVKAELRRMANEG